jgi:hypothetical protein
MRPGLLHAAAILLSDSHWTLSHETTSRVVKFASYSTLHLVRRECDLIGTSIPRFPRSTIKLLCITALQTAVARGLRAWPQTLRWALVAFPSKLQRALTIIVVHTID